MAHTVPDIKHKNWSSQWLFIMAATGSAVGLGNIWKFPYITGENGGGAFVLLYLACILLLGVPVMMTEIMLGRKGGLSPINSMRKLVGIAKASPLWTTIGWSGLLAGVMILSFYSVIAGWALAYIPMMATGTFTGIDAEGSSELFGALIADPWRLILWHSIFMLMTMLVIARGMEKGLERAISILLPGLFLLLLALVGYAYVATDQFGRALSFLFNPDFDALLYTQNADGQTIFNLEGILSALGLAFFSLSLGMGSIMVYGAYLPKESSIGEATISIVIADTLVAILAGLAIFPIVFSYGLDIGAGPGLVFVTLPIAFGNMGGGVIFGTLFFVLLVFAAWTSAFSLLEPVVAWLVESKRFSRPNAVWLSGGIIWLVGLLNVLSFNVLESFHPLSFLGEFKLAQQNIFGILDYMTSNVMLPLGGLAMALFAAWVLPSAIVSKEFNLPEGCVTYRTWSFLIHYVTPIGVGLIFLKSVGLI